MMVDPGNVFSWATITTEVVRISKRTSNYQNILLCMKRKLN
jgi:hypothetical protein